MYGYSEYSRWRFCQELEGKEVFLWMVKDRKYEHLRSSEASTVKPTSSHSSAGSHSMSSDEYEDGYSQGYYDAVHEDEDWEDDEEEDW